jgi:predicted RNase H-like HicB family nuclease
MEQRVMIRIVYRSEIFQEDDLRVGFCHDLDVSSFGDTPGDAQDSLKEAVEAFLEGCREIGSLDEVLTESGYVQNIGAWQLRERISEEVDATVA